MIIVKGDALQHMFMDKTHLIRCPIYFHFHLKLQPQQQQVTNINGTPVHVASLVLWLDLSFSPLSVTSLCKRGNDVR